MIDRFGSDGALLVLVQQRSPNDADFAERAATKSARPGSKLLPITSTPVTTPALINKSDV